MERPICPTCRKRVWRVGPYWLCTNLACARLVVDKPA